MFQIKKGHKPNAQFHCDIVHHFEQLTFYISNITLPNIKETRIMNQDDGEYW